MWLAWPDGVGTDNPASWAGDDAAIRSRSPLPTAAARTSDERTEWEIVLRQQVRVLEQLYCPEQSAVLKSDEFHPRE
jgi:hypothetical protein